MLSVSEITHQNISKRSTIYNIEPIGIGTPYVESMTSYITRLAYYHNVSVGDLVGKIILPKLNNPKMRKDLFFGWSKLLNGMGLRTEECINTLQELTLRSDLRFLTLSSWSKFVSSNDELFYTTLKWCPLCYQDWAKERKMIYDPLLWKIKYINYCDIHLTPLVDECPYCGTKPKILNSNSLPGHCSKCRKFLGNPLVSNKSTKKELFNNTLMSKSFSEVLMPDIMEKIYESNIHINKNIFLLIDAVANGSIRKFSRLVDISKQTIYYWKNDSTIPMLGNVLQVCDKLNITLRQLIFFEIPLDKIIKGKNNLEHSTYDRSVQKEEVKKLDKEELERFLLSILTSNEYPPPSMTDISKRLGLQNTHVRKLYPEISKQISTKYKRFRLDTKKERIRIMCQEVVDITLFLHSKGIYPTENQVKRLLSKPGNFRMKEVRDAFYRIRIKLGLEK